jgi:hypothetical protein
MRINTQFEDPHSSRVAVSVVNGEAIISIPPARNGFVLMFLAVWLGAWTIGGIMAGQRLLSGDMQAGARGFLLFWLCAWALGWAWAAGTLVWQLFGSEIVTANDAALTHSYRVFLWSRTRKFNPAHITNLRWKEGSGSRWSEYRNPSYVAFDYGAKTIQIAREADSGEGNYIVSVLRQRMKFPGGADSSRISGNG